MTVTAAVDGRSGIPQDTTPNDDNTSSSVGQFFSRCWTSVKSAACSVEDFFSSSVKKTEELCGILLFGSASLKLTNSAFKLKSTPLMNTANHLETVEDTLSAFLLVPKIVSVINTKKPETTKEKLDLAQKIISVFTSILSLFKLLDKLTVLNFAKWSAALGKIPVIGILFKLSPIRFVKDVFTVVACALKVAVEAISIKLNSDQRNIKELRAKKWTIIKQYKEEKVDKSALTKEYNDVCAKIQNTKENKKTIKLQKFIDDGSYDAKTIDLKINKNHLHEDIQTAEVAKSWLSIAFQIAKVAAVIIGLVGFFMALGSNPIFIACVSVAWFTVATIGIIKAYYTYKKNQEFEVRAEELKAAVA